MAKFDCYKVDLAQTPSGTAFKKLVLQEEGKQYPIKFVTMWATHPLFEDMVPGWSGELEIEEKDSGKPNPKAPGKNYINRTVIDSSKPRTQSAAPAPKPKDNGPHGDRVLEIYNLLNLKIGPLLEKIYRELVAVSGRQERQMGLDPKAIDDSFDDIQDSSPF